MPASWPAYRLSRTLRISYLSEWRTNPLAVLPSCSPNCPSQYTTAVEPRGRANGSAEHLSSCGSGPVRTGAEKDGFMDSVDMQFL
jgi:hypothetical protein